MDHRLREVGVLVGLTDLVARVQIPPQIIYAVAVVVEQEEALTESADLVDFRVAAAVSGVALALQEHPVLAVMVVQLSTGGNHENSNHTKRRSRQHHRWINSRHGVRVHSR